MISKLALQAGRWAAVAALTLCAALLPAAPPANDLCESATGVTAGQTYVGNTEQALTEASAASCDGGEKDVWFKLVVPSRAFYEINACGSAFTWELNLYTDCPGSGGSLIACANADAFEGSCTDRARLQAILDPGTYTIRLSDWFNKTGGNYSLRISLPEAEPTAVPPGCNSLIEAGGNFPATGSINTRLLDTNSLLPVKSTSYYPSGLAVDPLTGGLYGVVRVDQGGGSYPVYLARIGEGFEANLIGVALTGPRTGYFYQPGDIAIRPSDGAIFGVTLGTGTDVNLYRVDRLTGEVTDIGYLPADNSGGSLAGTALTFTSDGKLLLATNGEIREVSPDTAELISSKPIKFFYGVSLSNLGPRTYAMDTDPVTGTIMCMVGRTNAAAVTDVGQLDPATGNFIVTGYTTPENSSLAFLCRCGAPPVPGRPVPQDDWPYAGYYEQGALLGGDERLLLQMQWEVSADGAVPSVSIPAPQTANPGASDAPFFENRASLIQSGQDLLGGRAADDFNIDVATRIKKFRFWTYEVGETWDGTLDWRFHANDGGAPGAIVAQGMTALATRTYVGPAHGPYSRYLYELELPDALTFSPGRYWLSLHAAATCPAVGAISWAESVEAYDVANDAAGKVQIGCDGAWLTATLNSLSFQLFGPSEACGGPGTYDLYLDTVNPPVAQVASNLSTKGFITGPLERGTEYFWKVVAHNGEGSTESPVWSFTTIAAPKNDACADAQLIWPGRYYQANLIIATTDTPDPGNCGGVREVWYEYTPTVDGNAVFRTCGSSGDTLLHIYSGCPGSGGTLLECKDDSPGVECSGIGNVELQYAVTSGATYLIRVSEKYFNSVSGSVFTMTGPTPQYDGRPLGDFDNSGCTDLTDFLLLLDNWQLDLNGVTVGLDDFLALLDNWQSGPDCQ